MQNTQQQEADDDSPKVLVAVSNSIRNLVLPKIAMVDDVKMVGLADSPDHSLKMLIQERPDVVLVDTEFGGNFAGPDAAKMMQRTHSQAAIIMVVADIDPDSLNSKSRRFGTSWTYIKKTSAAKIDILSLALKSAARGVQWIEPDLTRPLQSLWRTAAEARDLETSQTRNLIEEYDRDDPAAGIRTSSTNDASIGGLNVKSVSVGKGGIGQNVGSVRRAG